MAERLEFQHDFVTNTHVTHDEGLCFRRAAKHVTKRVHVWANFFSPRAWGFGRLHDHRARGDCIWLDGLRMGAKFHGRIEWADGESLGSLKKVYFSLRVFTAKFKTVRSCEESFHRIKDDIKIVAPNRF